MSDRHTPGPWSAQTDAMLRDGAQRCRIVAMRSTRHDVATTCVRETSETEEANARLIAAAPDFMSAAQRLLAVFDQQRMTTAERIIAGISDAGLRTEGNAAIEALRAAVAKATGAA